MKSIHSLSRVKGQAVRGRLWVLVVVLVVGASVASAQSATVTGKVQTPHGETAEKPLKVLVILKDDGTISKRVELRDKNFNHTKKEYTYSIDRIRPGTYDFVVCDGLKYKSEVQPAAIGPGRNDPISFLLRDQPKGDGKIEGDHPRVEGRLVGAGYYVYLVQTPTKCIVAQTRTDLKSHYKFEDLPKGEYEVSFDETDP